MGRTVERIDRELAELDQAILQLGEELFTAYQTYLTVLGAALRKQFILAAHHICTQVYPQPFLQLSYTQRQNLQQKLMETVKQAHNDLLLALYHPNTEESQSRQPTPTEVSSHSFPFTPDQNRGDSGTEMQRRAGAPPDSLELLSFPSELNPGLAQRQVQIYQLRHWFEQQERNLMERLRQLSCEANRILQQIKILPPKVPDSLLEMTMRADLLNEAPSGIPNILDVTLDAIKAPPDFSEARELDDTDDDYDGNEQDYSEGLESGQSEIDHAQLSSLEDFLPLLKKLPIRFVALHLNLTDIEFSDTAAATHRNQIRQLAAKLNQAEKIYRHKQQERAVVAAEDAWQASWFES